MFVLYCWILLSVVLSNPFWSKKKFSFTYICSWNIPEYFSVCACGVLALKLSSERLCETIQTGPLWSLSHCSSSSVEVVSEIQVNCLHPHQRLFTRVNICTVMLKYRFFSLVLSVDSCCHSSIKIFLDPFLLQSSLVNFTKCWRRGC